MSRQLLLASLAVALLGQFLLTGEFLVRRSLLPAGEPPTAKQLAGAALLAAATVLGALSGRRATRIPDDGGPSDPSHGIPPEARRPAIAAAVAWGVAVGAYLAGGESRLCLAAWAASVLLLVGALVLGAPAWRGFSTTRLTRIGVGALVLVAFFLRHWRLTELPSAVHFDVPFMGHHTLAILESPDSPWIGLAPSAHLFMTHRFLALGLALFGQDHYGLVILGVLAGTATVPVVFLLGRELFGPFAGWLAAAFLSVSYTHVHFSRTLFGPVATLFVTLSILFLVRALRLGGAGRWALSGVFSALAVFNYYSGRVGPVVVAAFALGLFVRDRAAFRRTLPGWGVWAAGFLVTFGPMLAFALGRPAEFNGRGNTVVLWDEVTLEHSLRKHDATGWPELLAAQAKQALLAFHAEPDQSPHFTIRAPALSPIPAALLVAGAGLVLSRRVPRRSLVLPVWIGLTLLLGGVLTSDPPYWPHLNVLLPAASLLAGLAFAETLRPGPGAPAVALRAAAGVATLVVAMVGAANWSLYVDSFHDNAETWLRIVRAVRPFPDGTPVLLVSDDLRADHPGFRFFCRRLPFEDVAPEGLPGRLRSLVGPALVVLESHPDLAAVVRGERPEARLGELRRVGRRRVLVTLVRVGGAAPVSGGEVPRQRWKGWLAVAGLGGGLVGLWALAHRRSLAGPAAGSDRLAGAPG